MTTTPRTAERMLSALGAPAHLVDATLGDLAEEYALREARSGRQRARLWYIAEAVRSSVVLLGSAARSADAATIRNLVGVAFSASAIGTVGSSIIVAMTVAVLRVDGANALYAGLANTLVSVLLLGTIGYVAAALAPRREVPAALLAGLLWVLLPLALRAAFGVVPAHEASLLVMSGLMTIATILAGALLRIRNAPDSPVTLPAVENR